MLSVPKPKQLDTDLTKSEMIIKKCEKYIAQQKSMPHLELIKEFQVSQEFLIQDTDSAA